MVPSSVLVVYNRGWSGSIVIVVFDRWVQNRTKRLPWETTYNAFILFSVFSNFRGRQFVVILLSSLKFLFILLEKSVKTFRNVSTTVQINLKFSTKKETFWLLVSERLWDVFENVSNNVPAVEYQMSILEFSAKVWSVPRNNVKTLPKRFFYKGLVPIDLKGLTAWGSTNKYLFEDWEKCVVSSMKDTINLSTN